MNWNRFLVGICGLLFSVTTFGQTNILNAKKPEDIEGPSKAELAYGKNDPLEYGYVDTRDVLWSKTTWEIIDLDERVNFPLYYPIDTNQIGSSRRSLYDVLIKNIKNGKIQDIYADSYFNDKIQLKDISAALSKVDTTDLGIEQYNAGEEIDPQYISRRDISSADIAEYHIRGYWYFDKRQAELKYRLLGIAPVAPDVNFIDSDEPALVELFWVWFPSARKVLNEAYAFNPGNTSQPISYDHLLNARRFHGVIYAEDNLQGDRQVDDYINNNAFMQLLESQRIREQIRNFEQDMWNY
ncbi:protein involved in gliding motility GldN [Salinimicrobium catena]|uniref:Protein involved in gliding motility GldN n=1 Tax=Salinimicrobium catena TaxID=390640 RepID=A0A1H5GZ88_9FLAO|nr:gliding motility protein GldN [Salinimicrobium catena]SDK66665.1 protein involved in gliding motility GldN [Salinimicrobium catena]SEE20945.1 protein involved in gliding motility GldN [Salinimicrobium catena]